LIAKNDLRLVNKPQLATIFNKSLYTIDAWLRRGMPFVERGDKTTEWKFDSGEVGNWREEQAIAVALGNMGDVEIEEARRRKIAAEAGILEITLKAKQGEFIDRDEVETGLMHAYTMIKQRLRTIPERIVPQLMGESNEQYVREMLLDEIDDALLELSQADYGYDADTTQES
jgi:phage terminase Nu1 subunit (DNA packaging protein)